VFREGLSSSWTSVLTCPSMRSSVLKKRDVGLPVLGVLALAVIGPTAGRWYVDVVEWCAAEALRAQASGSSGIALLTGFNLGGVRVGRATSGPAPPSRFVVGYTLRVVALYRGWRNRSPRSRRACTSTTTGRPALGAS